MIPFLLTEKANSVVESYIWFVIAGAVVVVAMGKTAFVNLESTGQPFAFAQHHFEKMGDILELLHI